MAAFSVVTWNVNSVKARHDRLLAFLERAKPNVLCLQELKVTDEAFPSLEVRAAGYHAATFGQKTYNGVAILSKEPATDVQLGLGDDVDDPQARLITATVAGLRVACAYFPNGGDVGSEKWTYKLAWMKRLRAWLDRTQRADAPFVLCGDFNVAPDDLDVQNPDSWKDTVLCHPEARAALEHVRGFGLLDAFRPHHPAGHVYSWWDYRNLGFPKNDGLRIDHVFATESLASTCVAARVDRDERKGKQPSDHAPVIATFER